MRDIYWVVRRAKRKAPSGVLAYLETWQDALMDDDVASGKMLISTAEAGGSVSFSALPGYSPIEMLRLVEEAIQWLQTQADPNNPNLTPRRIKRMRVSFAKAVL